MILRFYTSGLLQGLIASSMAFASPHKSDQTVLSPHVPEPDNLAGLVRPAGNRPSLADLLTLEGRASIFYSYARETDMSALFTRTVGDGDGTTVFVPTNKAVQALAKKPHEDFEETAVTLTDAEHEAVSKHNVQRWVGAHIIPTPEVDFTSSKPYDTLTAGATITFSAIQNKHRLTYELDTHIDIDAAHLGALKGKESYGAHLKATKRCPYADASSRYGHFKVDTDAAHLPSIKEATTPDHDAAHFSDLKGSVVQEPIWKQYELNDGVHIISMKQASNGVMYLIDGTVPV